MIEQILTKIALSSKHHTTIGIDGPTASGKTMLAKHLALMLEQTTSTKPQIFEMDWTLCDRAFREADARKSFETSTPITTECTSHMILEIARRVLENTRWRCADLVLDNLYDRENGQCTKTVFYNGIHDGISIFEGHYTAHRLFSSYVDVNILLLAAPEELLRRKIERAKTYRDPVLVEKYFYYIDLPSFLTYLEHEVDTRHDLVFDNTDFRNPVQMDDLGINQWIENADAFYRKQIPNSKRSGSP